MVMMFSDGSRAYVWTCPYCGWTKASETAQDDHAAKAAHPRDCRPLPRPRPKR